METLIISIDTKFIKNKKSISNFEYKLPYLFKNVVELKLSSIEIPNTIYTFDKSRENDYFVFKIMDKTFRFYLQNGNYDIKELYDVLLDFFNDIEHYNFFNNEPLKISFSFDLDNAKFKIESNIEFSLYFYSSDEYYTLGRLLGFNKISYIDKKIIISESIPDIIGDKYLFLKINDFGNIYHNNKKYFSKVIINKESYEMIYNSQHKFITKEFKFNQPINIDSLKIKIEDYIGNNVNFNGIDLSMTLEFKLVKNDLLRQFYERYSFDHELLKLILHDSMLKYYVENNSQNCEKFIIADKFKEINKNTFNYDI